MALYELTLMRSIRESTRVIVEIPEQDMQDATADELWDLGMIEVDSTFAEWDVEDYHDDQEVTDVSRLD